ncbi:MAG: hypothetical protein J6Y79_03290, partial [Paludibacteraceae bacterium]|nr:hypothetical protein [Paludibacteraceae bacterium]
KNSKGWLAVLDEGPDSYKLQEVEYHDRTLYLNYIVSEGRMILNMSPDDTLSLKQYLCATIKNALESDYEVPEIISDTVLITAEGLLQHLRGVKLLFIEENTRKALTLDISAEDLANAKLPAVVADQETEDKILEQVMAERFIIKL